MSYSPGSIRLRPALKALLHSGVVACPTEAVWGLSCDPYNERAVDRLLALKNRPPSKGLILVAASQHQFDFLLSDVSSQASDTLAASWPGPVTWVVPHHGRVPPWVSGGHDTVAVRVSNHPVVSALCMAWGGPLVSTSANPAGARPAREAFQVRRYFGDLLDCLLPGSVGNSERTTIIRNLMTGQILRN